MEATYAHLMSPMTMAFTPVGPGRHHPAPWKQARGGFGQDIITQVTIPPAAGETAEERQTIATTILFLLRLWSDPSITLPAISNMPFATIRDAADAVAHIIPVEHRQKSFPLAAIDSSRILNSLPWVVTHFEPTFHLMTTSSEFRLAAGALDTGQFVENSALALISLWGALEAIFSPSTSELRFRVSSLIAAYTKPRGPTRLAEQRRIVNLYDKRSAAAHGKPSHAGDDLLQTFELLRSVLIKIIGDGKIPTKNELEELLFG
ncbi:hypothetical protein C3941_15745 [Kaistia algarum]|nr:hypothetical protein C3941_15745 [Kaistia algarum]